MLDIQLVKTQTTPINLTYGSVVTYTIEIRNNGDIPINNAVLLDTIPNETTFVVNSVTLNGVPTPSADPSVGVFVGDIPVGTISTLSFDITINTFPFTPYTIVNSSSLMYYYILDQNVYFTSTNSNEVSALVQGTRHCFGDIISVDKNYVTIGDNIKYTVGFTNQCATNYVYISDQTSSCLSFVPGSVIINGNSVPEANPVYPNSISVYAPSTITAQTVTFNVKPITCPCIATSTITVALGNDYDSPIDTKIFTTTIVCPTLPCLSVNKIVDKLFATVGDTISYNISIKNNCPIDLNDVYFTDYITPCVSFVKSSLSVGDIAYADLNPIYPNTIRIGPISAGDTTTVSFKVTATTCPCVVKNTANVFYQDNTILSNTVTTTIVCPTTTPITIPLQIKKEACNCISCVEDKIPYTIKVKNISSSSINNIIVEDIIPYGVYIYTVTVSNGLVSKTDTKLTWNITNLEPGENAAAMIIMMATPNVCFNNQGYIINTSKIVSYNGSTTNYNISDIAIHYINCFNCNCKK